MLFLVQQLSGIDDFTFRVVREQNVINGGGVNTFKPDHTPVGDAIVAFLPLWSRIRHADGDLPPIHCVRSAALQHPGN